MSKPAVDKFLALVERSGLIPRNQLAEATLQWQSQATSGRADDERQCGEFLVRRGLLTPWQCHKLLEGRHRGFLMGNYKLLDHLGSGGMSNVYLAEHVLMQRRVAIKVLPQNRVADGSYLARFHFEGQATGAMDHRNIVRAYDLGCEGRIHYLVMEYVDGSDLEALVERIGPLDYHAAANYIAQAAAGLEHAHASGLVHRDIKPANLLVDRHGTVKILDMGLAKFKAEVRPIPAFARDEEVLGTAEYLAPEQAVNSLSVDHRADIYALGCTLYFLLTGHPPFAGTTSGELVAAHQQQPAPSVLVDRPDAPPPLLTICEKMMAKAPAERFQSAREVVDALVGWLEAERAAGRVAAASPGEADRFDPTTRVSSATRDTDPNLKETTRIDEGASKPTNTPSDILSPANESVLMPSESRRLESNAAPPAPPAPPLVPPPREAQVSSMPPIVAAALPPVVPPPSPFSPVELTRPSRPLSEAGRPVTPARGSLHWLWPAVLSALVIGAILLAIFAFA